MLVQGHITQENPMQLEHIKLVEASTAVVWLRTISSLPHLILVRTEYA